MGVGRGADQQRVDVAGVDDGVGIADFRAGPARRAPRRPCRPRRRRRPAVRPRRCGDVAAVDLADPPGAEQPETQHGCFLSYWNECSELTGSHNLCFIRRCQSRLRAAAHNRRPAGPPHQKIQRHMADEHQSARDTALDVITIGRSSVDLYGQQIGSRLEDVASFAKSVGGCPANIAIGAARLGLKSGHRHRRRRRAVRPLHARAVSARGRRRSTASRSTRSG